MQRILFAWIGIGLAFILSAPPVWSDEVEPLPGTEPLDWQGDLAARMVAGADRFLLKKVEESVVGRAKHWKRDLSSADAYNASVEPNRKRLAHILGVRDALDSSSSPLVSVETLPRSFLLDSAAQPDQYLVKSVRWPAFGDVQGEGLILLPKNRTNWNAARLVLVLPDADQSPEQLAGLAPGLPAKSQVARRLAESGCTVVVPALIDRTVEARNGRAELTNREYLQRSAFELGRTVAGYEVQKVLAYISSIEQVVEEFLTQASEADRDDAEAEIQEARIGLFGYGEGGLIALYAAALDPRIDAVVVSGAFDDRMETWKEPVDRNVFGLLEQFGGAELASLVAPRTLIIEAAEWPDVTIPPGTGGAPGRLKTPALDALKNEVDRARQLVEGLKPEPTIELIVSGEDGDGPFGTEPALRALLQALDPKAELAPLGDDHSTDHFAESVRDRQKRQVHEIDRHNQQLLAESPYVRAEFMKGLDTSTLEKFNETIEPYRDHFANEVIGRFDEPALPPNPRTRKIFEEEKYTGYEVVLDVWPDVFAYGILVLPKGIQEGEKRPVVVCQHGLEGRPNNMADPSVNRPAYNQFALKLTERGFIIFAPQNLYIGQDDFRTLQRKANPIKKTLFSIMVPQHQQICDWLKSLPQVDPERIAFYGLSYGGKSAMRIPPLVQDYCLSICSGDFNEWVWKNASTRSPYSYVWTGEYEIYEFDLGSTFNYAEMAALIAPRPFMVERGHFDGVAPDEMVAYEFAKVRFLYEARLNLPKDVCQIEWFNGGHAIHGVGTFEFLHQHLDWPMTTPPEPLTQPRNR